MAFIISEGYLNRHPAIKDKIDINDKNSVITSRIETEQSSLNKTRRYRTGDTSYMRNNKSSFLDRSKTSNKNQSAMFPSINKNNEELKQMVAQAMQGIIQDREEYHPKKLTLGKSQSVKVIGINEDRIKEEILDAKLMPTMREIKYLFEKLVGEKFEKEMRPDMRIMNEDLDQVTNAESTIAKIVKEETDKILKSVPMKSQAIRQMTEYDNISKK